MMMHYIVKENVFVVIVSKLLQQQKNQNVIKNCFEIYGK